MKKKLTLLTLILSFTTFLVAQPPCEGTLCQDVCFDLTATISGLPTEVCVDEGFQYQIEVAGPGADIGAYNILTFNFNGTNTGFDVHNPGDPATISPMLFTFVPGCAPVDQIFTYEIQCAVDGSILAAGTVGTITAYPSPSEFVTFVTPSIACVQDLLVTPLSCGTIIFDPDPLPVPGCGGVDTQVNWSVDFGFEYPPSCPVEPIFGTETIFACNGTPGDSCDDDDANPCTANDTLDENCNCVGEVPTVTANTTIPNAVCRGIPFTLNVTIDLHPDVISVFVVISDQFGVDVGFQQVFSSSTIDIEVSPFNQNNCDIFESELFLEARCPSTFFPIGEIIPLGTQTVYPFPNWYTINVTPGNTCEAEPVIEGNFCGTLTTVVTPPSLAACPTGTNGFVEWTIDPGFDTTNLPDCLSDVVFTGQEPITACSDCCPLVVDISLAETGPFCSGDITEVCVTFDVAFETDGEVSINGVDAVAGDDQICFQFELINTGCNYEPAQLPFEIICNEGITNIFTPGVLIAPDPANFPFTVFPGSCDASPSIGSPGFPCIVASNPGVIITEPIDGCPPIAGEVEIPLVYYNENDYPLDVEAFGCPGLETSLVLPQQGCSTCPCPNPPISVDVSPNICEGGLIEICIEFEQGDEANAIASIVQIIGDAGTFIFDLINGDGMSTTYCIELVSGASIACEPVVENLTVNIFCAANTSNIFTAYAVTNIYPSLDKFAYEVIPAVNNCPVEFIPPDFVMTGPCDLDIQSSITTTPVDGCPPVPGEITYSINYIDATLFANAPAGCLFTPVVDAMEPLPACDTCSGGCEDEIMGTVFAPVGCNVSGIEVTIYDDMGNIVVILTTDMNGIYDSTPTTYPCGNYSVELTNNLPQCYLDASGETGPKTFIIDGDDNNTDTDGQDFMLTAIPTLSQWGLIVLCLLLMCFGAVKISNITVVDITL